MLEDFTYQGDIKSPKITLKGSGELEFSGRSLPENAKEIYAPVFNWMTTYKSNPAEKTVINFKLEYFNTTSSKMIYEVLKIAEEMIKSGNNVDLNWHLKRMTLI